MAASVTGYHKILSVTSLSDKLNVVENADKSTSVSSKCDLRDGYSCLSWRKKYKLSFKRNSTFDRFQILERSKFFRRLSRMCVRLVIRRSWVRSQPCSAFFRDDWSWNIYYCLSLTSADPRRAVVSFWRENKHKYRFITKTCLFKYIEDFTSKKLKNFQIKPPIFFIFLLKP